MLQVLLLLVILGACSGQLEMGCPIFQESELGNTTEFSSVGLLADALANASLSYRLLQYNIVCLAQGTARDLYRSTSLVVRYLDSAGGNETRQLHLQCDGGAWSTSGLGVVTAADATLTTSLRKDCHLCVGSSSFSGPGLEHHCLACPAECTLCGLINDQVCCNVFDFKGLCAIACPANSSPNDILDCECDSGFTLSGDRCVEDSDCSLNPCENGATCSNSSCICAVGYTGVTCSVRIDHCEHNPCENKGMCVNEIDGFSCDCLEGWTGPLCQTCSLSGCVRCTLQLTQNRTICSECDDGYVLSNSSCHETALPTECDIAGCANCSDEGAGCVQCGDQFELTENFKCERISSSSTGIIVGIVIVVLLLLVLMIMVVIILLLCWQCQYTTYEVTLGPKDARERIQESYETV